MTPIGEALPAVAWQPLTVRLPRDLLQRYKQLAQVEHRSLNGQLVTALQGWIEWQDGAVLLTPLRDAVVVEEEMVRRVRAVMQGCAQGDAARAAERELDTALQLHTVRMDVCDAPPPTNRSTPSCR